MLLKDSFSPKLNDIFSRFHGSGSIVIGYKEFPENQRKGEGPPVIVTSVNGQDSVRKFAHFCLAAKARTKTDLLETLKGVNPADRPGFLKLALARCRKVRDMTMPVNGPGDDNRPVTPLVTDCRFLDPVFDDGNGGKRTGKHTARLLLLTERYARIWRTVAVELTEEVQCFACITDYHYLFSAHSAATPFGAPPQLKKIVVTVNVGDFAAMARMFFDHEAFAINNKTDFCRMVSDNFSTIKQKQISYKSFRNLFNAPSPESIKRMLDELSKLMKNSQKFLDGK
jgi:hypothetical protein